MEQILVMVTNNKSEINEEIFELTQSLMQVKRNEVANAHNINQV